MAKLKYGRALSWIRRLSSVSGLVVVVVSLLWLITAAVGYRGSEAGITLVYADDPPTTKATTNLSKDKNGSAKNGAKSPNDNDSQNAVPKVNIIAKSIEPRDSEQLIVGEKVKICLNYTVEGDGDGRFNVGLRGFDQPLQFERVKLEEGAHSECFEVKVDEAGDFPGAGAVDYEYEIDETNEQDNFVGATLTWIAPPRPDLLFGGGIELSTQAPESCNDRVTAYAWMNNDGQAKAKKFDVEAFIDGERVDRKQIHDFDAESQQLLELDKLRFKSPGPHTLVLKMDVENDVDETNEQNNETSTSVNLTCQDNPNDDDDDDDDDD